ncbi:MAG: hypothetical protein JW763_10275 [candidate division Zixibacteria bacterium]|nr:hypothetical protein [candidate division Zixibacteria bacterium]
MNLIIGITGMILLLAGFALNILKLKREDSFTYIILNILGGGLSTYYAVTLTAIPFVILETIWSLFAIYKLMVISIIKRPDAEKRDASI